jgi:hypothetical protein
MDKISIRLFVVCIPSAGHSPGPRSSFWLIEDLHLCHRNRLYRQGYGFQVFSDVSLRVSGGPFTVDRNQRIASRPQLHQTHRSSLLLNTFQKNQQILLIDYPLWPNVLLCTSLTLYRR